MNKSVDQSALDGDRLYGDDFSFQEILSWYQQEESGYFDLLAGHYGVSNESGEYHYEYAALNRLHAINILSRSRFKCCLALGCASGSDVAPLGSVVEQFIAIEPAEKWWRSEIGGAPARYLKPAVSGDIPLSPESVDIAISFGVLHHIPNVSHVIAEVHRVLVSGGLFAVREPISSMGDWRKPRVGLTANERGLPMTWFEKTVEEAGFRIVRRRLCMFGPLTIIAKRLGLSIPYSSQLFALIDWCVCEAFRWNVHYRRDAVFKKFAPGSAFWILEKK